MSRHCKGCRYDPAQRTGERACPFTTLYWDFLMRHEALLGRNQRMALQVKNLTRIGAPERALIARAGGVDPARRGVTALREPCPCVEALRRSVAGGS